MPTKNAAIIISIIMPFCGELELTPHSCLSKSSWSRLVILEFSSWQRRGLTAVNARRVFSVPQKPDLFQSQHSKIISGAHYGP
jgi:hypothetical protein